MLNTQSDILEFWFETIEPQQWFQKSDEFDHLIKDKFEETYNLARDGVFEDWTNDPEGCLALCVLLSQFPRFMYRGTAKIYDGDSRSLVVAKKAVARGFDQILSIQKRRFIYMPYKYSEKKTDQDISLKLFEGMKADDPISYEQALKAHKIIDEYGRFPGRNEILARSNSPEEDEYLSLIAS